MNIFKNIALDLRAAGPAAVVIVWIICVTVLGVVGKNWIIWAALLVLHISGAFIVGILWSEVRTKAFRIELEALKESYVHVSQYRDKGEDEQSDHQPE